MPILNSFYGGDSSGGGNIGEPLNLTVTTSGLDATIKWEDNEIGTIPPTTFQKSELVRKIGSAPTSPSDGVLVVTETVKDTYKVSGYVDQGLTNGTTYYYRVFSYSDLGGISYCDAVSVTPSQGWQPGANTIAYYPLTSVTTVNDMKGSGTAYNLSYNGTMPTFGTYSGVDCAYFSSSGTLYTTAWSGGVSLGNYTISCWFYKTDKTPNDSGLIVGLSGNHTQGDYVIASLYNKTRPSSSEGVIGINEGSPGYYTSPYFVSGWNNLVVTQSGSTGTFYVNNQQIGTFTINSHLPDMINISRYMVSPDTLDRSIRGYISEVIIEDKTRTAQEVSDYFDLTKGDYGIS